ncbi:uncharacterized protein [Paramisgurnus dabryanus]|uniref:uncharacterized protein n=1 Tax=Paramisgurnus dabryanus TaxID=90735 RepID=UPI003CCFA686
MVSLCTTRQSSLKKTRVIIRATGVFGDKVKSVSVYEGESVTLHTDITELQRDDLIEWWFKEIRIARIKSSDINPINAANDKTKRFRDRLKINNQTADLTITNITPEHTGNYELIKNGEKIVKKFYLTVYASPTTTNANNLTQENIPDYKLLISCTAAAAAVGFITSVLIFWIYSKHTKTHQQDQTCEDEIAYADPKFRKRNTQNVKDESEVIYATVNPRS